MYDLRLRNNRWMFILALAVSVAMVIYLTRRFPEELFEIPAAAFFVGEAGLSLLLALLFYESASTGEAIRLSAAVFGMAMFIGSVGNYVCRSTEFMPDNTLLVSWVQVAIMNIGGLGATIGLFCLGDEQTHPLLSRGGPVVVSKAEPVSAPMVDGSQPTDPDNAKAAAGQLDSAKDLLDRLDVSRINRLERSLRPPEKVSLENLFREETTAAQSALDALQGDSREDSGLELGNEAPSVIRLETPKNAALRIDLADRSQPGGLQSQNSTQIDDPATNASGHTSAGNQPPDDPSITTAASASSPPLSAFEALLQGEDSCPGLASLSGAASSSGDQEPSPETSRVFGEDVAEEVDQLFSNMFTAESQKEVSIPEPTCRSTVPPEEPEKLAETEPVPGETPVSDRDLSNPAPNVKSQTDQRIGYKPVAADDIQSLIASLMTSENLATPTTTTSEQPAEGINPDAHEEIGSSPGSAAPSLSERSQLKEFGRLGSSSGSYPAYSHTESGMKSIGKMLLDVQAVENIIRSGETRQTGLTTARVISAARGEGIKSLLSKIDSYPGIQGSVIVGYDGLVIASTLGSDMDKDILGAMSTAIHSTTNLATERLELGDLHQTVLQSDNGIVVLTAVNVGILSVFSNNRELGNLNGLLEAIEATVHG